MRRWIVVGLYVLLGLVPFLVQQDPYWLSLLTKLFINSILALSLWPLFVVGRLNMGHAAFYGMGAFGVAVLMLDFGLSFWIALPIVLVLVAIVAAIFGYPTLRIRGAYFGLATFAIVEITRLTYLRFDKPFGGAQGLFNVPPVSPIALPGLPELSFASYTPQYYLVFAALVLTTAFYYRYVHSSIGLTMRSIHESSQLSEAVGVNIFRFEIVTYVLGSVGAGVAGALFAGYARYLDPNTFSMWKSFEVVGYIIVGGTQFVLGPLVGVGLLTLLPELLNIPKEGMPIVTAAALMFVMFAMPGGLVSLPRELVRLARRLRRRRQPDVAGAPQAHTLDQAVLSEES